MRGLQYWLLLVLFCGIQTLFPQTYIIKFKSVIPDTAFIRTTLTASTQKPNRSQNSFRNVRITGLASRYASQSSEFPWGKYVVLRTDGPIDRQDLDEIKNNQAVEDIRPSHTYKIYSMPNDSANASQWNLSRIGISQLYISGIISTSLPEVIVGVIDTGIDEMHPDLSGSIAIHPGETGFDHEGKDKRTNGVDDDGNGFIDDWRGYDFVESSSEGAGDWNERDNHPHDEHGHGTSVSGIIGATINNGIGLTGIAPCSILPVRAFGKDGNGNDIDIASAIVYAVDNGADVINMSFGDVVQSLLLQDAVRYAHGSGAVLVASSGNDGSDLPHYPSDFPEVISTGSVNQFDSRSFFSSHSPSLDIMAPGEQIVTTVRGGGYTGSFSGTSAAAPHVSGVVALLRSLEKKKKNQSPSYIPFSNDDISGILLNAADDAGKKGWDDLYGAGILNAEKAVHAIAGTSVIIHSPLLNELLTGSAAEIIITASSPYLRAAYLMYGRGDTPVHWTTFASFENTILIRDTVPFPELATLPDDVYILRLLVTNSKGNDVEFRQRIRILRTPPKILSLKFRDSVIVGNVYGSLIEARTDRNTTAALYIRPVGELQYRELRSVSMQMNHSFIITANDVVSDLPYEAYCEFTESSSARRSVVFYLTDSIGSPLIFSSNAIPTTGFNKKSYSLPKGFLLNSVQSVDGRPLVIINEYDENNDFGKMKIYNFSGTQFSALDSLSRPWIPRSIHRSANSGSLQLLVQDRGVSQVFAIDTVTGNILDSPLWGDSSDVWGSRLIDLDGDHHPEIIARSSTEYLLYKNNGNNSYALETRLPNPSLPLPGDAQNQFGPPRAVVGDFTNSGRTEIIFADYDGDVIMYRQTISGTLSFTLAGIDTSDLFEMSDFIVSGDFNGDGIMDIAVAGHSNPYWNQDREFDAPVWTVRVFSHLPSNQPGEMTKIWEQHFAGVRSGSANDNGLISGKISLSDPNDALFLSLNPNLYIVTWNGTRNTFEAVWMHSSQSNSVIVHDFDNDGVNDFGFHTNAVTEFWSADNFGLGVRSPWGVTAVSTSSSSAHVRWNSAASNHHIYRGLRSDSLHFLAAVAGIEWIDTVLTEGIRYYYAVSAVASGESPLSSIVSAVPHQPVRIMNVRQNSAFQLSVSLSYDVISDALPGISFEMDRQKTSSSVVWKSPRSLLITFTEPVAAGNHFLRIVHLIDADGMAGDSTRLFMFTSTYHEGAEFYVRSISLRSRNEIVLEFSDLPDPVQTFVPSSYSVKTIARKFDVTSVTGDTLVPTVVVLHFSEQTNLTEVALRLEITVGENITSAGGVPLMGGKGQVLSIAQQTAHIGNIVAYPNPAKGVESIRFVNLPENCTISIFSLNGERIKDIDGATTAEGISWNLSDERGNPLSSGVYLYRVEKRNDAGVIEQTHLGKFAVIR